jgi:hypothetical protein
MNTLHAVKKCKGLNGWVTSGIWNCLIKHVVEEKIDRR